MKKINKWVVRVFVAVMLLAQLVPLHQVAANEPTTDETTVESVATNETTVQPNATETSAEHPTGEALITSDELPPVTTVESEVEENKATTPTDVVLEKAPETPVETPVESEAENELDELAAPMPVVASAQPAQAESPRGPKPIDNVITSIKIEREDGKPLNGVGMWTLLKTTFNLSLPNNTIKGGDYTIVTLPDGFDTSLFPPFDLYDSNGKKIATVTCKRTPTSEPFNIPSLDTITITYDKNVETLSDVTGTFLFRMRLDHEYLKTPKPVDTTFKVGNDVNITADPSNVGFTGIVLYDPIKLDKSGWFDAGSAKSIQYRLIINQRGLSYSNLVIEDYLDDGLINLAYIDTSTMRVEKGKWTANASGSTMILKDAVVVNPAIEYNIEKTGFKMTIGDVAPDEGYAVYYKVKLTYDATEGELFKNTGTFKTSNNNDYVDVSTVKYTGAGGSSMGYNFKVKIVKTNESGASLPDAEFKVVRDRTGVEVGRFTTGSDGTVTIENLLKDAYTIEETRAPQGYQLNTTKFQVTENDFTSSPIAVVNVTNKRAETEISGQKHWQDENNQDGLRPAQITVILKADGVVKEEKVVTAADNWSYKFSKLPTTTDAGVPITYTVDEKPVPGYTKTINNHDITNTHTPEVITISGQKHWEDENNQDGVRPAQITVILKADGVVKEEKVVTATDNWAYTFSNLPKYRDQGVLIVYTIEEKPVDDYQTGYNPDNYDIVNLHTPEVIEISGQKEWVDNNNQDGVRPTEITVILKADGVVKEEKVVTATDNWSYTFSNLPKYRDQGVLIVYTIEEKPVANYEGEVDGYDLVNTHVPSLVDIEVSKVWIDNNNQDGIRPQSIHVQLVADHEDVVGRVVELNQGNGWHATFDNLPEYKAGQKIVYSVREVGVPVGYNVLIQQLNAITFEIKNTHTPEVIEISGQKEWVDNNNQDNARPTEITVILKADGVVKEEKVVKATDNWSYTFSNLPKYRDQGVLIVYTIDEKPVDGYTKIVDGFNLKNTYTPEVIEISGQKHWEDANNQDGVRPTEITVILKADGVVKEEKVVTATDNWSYTFSNLPKYRDQGVVIVYTVEEKPVTNYEVEVNGFDLVNKHTPEVIEISGQKHWEDADNQDGVRPNEITVILKADGVVKEEKVVTATDNWSYTFSNLPKYRDQGVAIVYTVEEKPITNYEVEVNGFDLVNKHTPEVIEISGQKHWEDENNQDGVRPAQITVILKADGVVKEEKVVKATDNWSFTFSNLPKYRDQGVAIVYTIEEKPVDDYQTGYNPNNYDIVNVHTPEVIEISGQKHWEDADNQDGVRPTEITVILKADDVVKEEKVVTATDNWSYTFSNLPKYRDQGVAIVYTIEEKPVANYEVEVNGFDLVNKHTPEVIEISGQKHWEDADNQDGVRPNEITVILKADGVVKEEKVVKATDNWAYTFSNLPKYRDQGVAIVYTIEEKPVDDYQTGYNPDNYDIVNLHTPEVIEISGQKEWVDNNNQDGVRPNEITVILKADGIVKEEKVVTATDNWSYTFSNLPKYRDQGVAIVYTIEEKPVDDYQTGYNPNNYDIVNVHTPEVIEISGQKHWEDNNNQDGVRPTEITVILKADGVVKESKVVKATDNWSYTFSNLPKYRDQGVAIVYTIEEKPVANYEGEVNGYDLVNKHTPDVIEISGQKHWEDENNQDGVRPTEITVILKADGVVKEEKVVTATDNWMYTFSNLPKYRDQGVAIVYTVEEKPVANYEVEVNGYDLVNKHTPEVIEISGQKHWEDNNNQDGVRPTEIIVILKANGEVVAEKVVKAEDGWKYTFENLPKFKAGKEIVYTIEEKTVEGYTTIIKAGQFDITNTHKPEMVEIGVEKVWQDEQNKDGSRPQTITVVLLANGEKVAGKTIELSASVNWKGVFENLPKYKDGQVIKYSVEEVNVPKGYKAVVTEKGTYQFIITNSHTPELPNTGMSHGAEVGLLALGCFLVGILLIVNKKSESSK